MLSLCLVTALAADLTVGPAGAYATLDDALAAAADGDRLLVEPGSYVEPELDVGARAITLESTAPGVLLSSTAGRRAFAVSGGSLTMIGVEIDLDDDIGLLDLQGGSFEIVDSVVRNARAPIPGQPGGSIDAQDGTVVVRNTLLDGAVAPIKDGGHIYALRTDVTVEGSTLLSGSAAMGGTIYLDEGSLTVTDSTLADDVGDDAAVYVRGGPVVLTRTTLQGHGALAVRVELGDVEVIDSTFEGNLAGVLHVVGGALSVTGGSFVGNTGDEAVAVWAEGDLLLEAVRFEGNVASVADVVRCDGGATCTVLAPQFEGNGGPGALLSVRGATAELTGGIVCLQDFATTLVSVDGAGSLAMSGTVVLANQLSGVGLTVAADSSANLVNNSWALHQADGSLVQTEGVLTLTNNLFALTTSAGPAVQANGPLVGGYNLYFGNSGGDVAPGPLGTDLTGIDPGIGQPMVGSCDVDVLKPRYGSPLIDGGDPKILDPDGSPSDIGAFGGTSPNPDPGTEYDDLDGDGFGIPSDCDDTDPDVSPGAAELPCNGIDDDCSADTPDNVDVDGDGVGVCDDDCDDEDARVFEIVEVYLDQDFDGYGIGEPTAFCLPPNNSALLDGDCDDLDPDAYPGAPEIPYDEVDQDCDGEDLDDLDGDGALFAQDCDDDDPDRYPSNDDVPDDGIDQDCTGDDVVTTINGGAGWRCGCASGGPASWGWALLPLLVAMRRRR